MAFFVAGMSECLRLFSQDTRTVIKSEPFCTAHLTTIMTIFCLESLNIVSELDLLAALFEYAQKNYAV